MGRRGALALKTHPVLSGKGSVGTMAVPRPTYFYPPLPALILKRIALNIIALTS